MLTELSMCWFIAFQGNADKAHYLYLTVHVLQLLLKNRPRTDSKSLQM